LTLQSKSGAVLLITFRRTEELKQTIDHLQTAWNEPYKELYVLVHADFPKVRKIIDEIDWINPHVIEVTHDIHATSATNINRNVFLGLSEVFSRLDLEFVTVIEDDICVSSDFLRFSSEIYKSEISNSHFMGINGFSGAEYSAKMKDKYGRFRFSFGWGWTIPRRTWIKVRKYIENNPQSHWDGLIEPVVKSGFVVMPHNSRVFNIGFGETASHTKEKSDYEIRLRESFGPISEGSFKAPYQLMIFDLNWRFDAVSYIDPMVFRGKVVNSLYKLMSRIMISQEDGSLMVMIKQHSMGLIQKMAIAIGKR
jgi:hypothetical protein